MLVFLGLSLPSKLLTSLGLSFVICNMGLVIFSVLHVLGALVELIEENRYGCALQTVKHYANVIFSHVSTVSST